MKEVSPKIFGPGTWIVLHIVAMDCDRGVDHEHFLNLLHRILARLPCRTCRKHSVEYYSNNPPPIRSGELFKWTWQFHNAVNKRLGKRQMGYEEAYDLYDNAEILEEGNCSSCGSEAGDSMIVDVTIEAADKNDEYK